MAKKITTVSNANRTIRLTIDEHDIMQGRPRDQAGCAAALCILRSVPGADQCRVHRGYVYLRRYGKWERYRPSGPLRLETIIFDRNGAMYPGDYLLLPVPLSVVVPRKPKPKEDEDIVLPRVGRGSNRPPRIKRRYLLPGTRPRALLNGDWAKGGATTKE
jgi:hypothetical protein